MKNSIIRCIYVAFLTLMLTVVPFEARSASQRDNNRGGGRGTHRTERTSSQSRSRSSERKSAGSNAPSRSAGSRNNSTPNRSTVNRGNAGNGNAGFNRGNTRKDQNVSRGNGILQGNRGGAVGNRPTGGNNGGGNNQSNRPNGTIVNGGNHNGNHGNFNGRPGNGGGNHNGNNGGNHNGNFNGRPGDHGGNHGGNHFGHDAVGIPRPPKHNGHYRPVPPPRPFHYSMRPPRPMPPAHYRPYCGPVRMSLGEAILAFTLGTAFNASLDYFFDNGYSVGGFANDVIYLNNVSMCNFIWPETSLFYNNGYLATQQYCYASPYNDRARFNIIYRDMCRAYGNPYMRNLPSGLSATWMADGGNYITLEYQPTYSPSGVLNFFTTLTFGL